MKIFSSLKNQATSFLEQYRQKNPTSYAAAEQAIGAVLIADGLVGIDNPFGEKKRPGIFGAVVGIIFGIVFLFIPSFFGNISGLNNMTAKTTATVVSVGTSSGSDSNSCSIVARYTVDGKEYTQQSSFASSSNCAKSEGQTISIDYDPANPGAWGNNVKTVGFFVQIFFWIGVFMIISSLGTFVIRLFSIIFGWKLLMSGRKLAAEMPQDTNFQTLIDEIKKNFIGTVFNFGGSPVPTIQTAQPTTQVGQPAPTTPLETAIPPVETPPSEQNQPPESDKQ